MIKSEVLFLIDTCEVMELWQCFHDNANQRQVKHGDPSLDLRISVAGVRVMTRQKVVNDADHFLMQAKHPGKQKRKINSMK